MIEPEEVIQKTGYSRPHTVHCGPEGIYISTLGGRGADGTDGAPGIIMMDCETFEIMGPWSKDMGNQLKGYDFWWNISKDYMVSSEWALPPQFENGIVAEDLLSNRYGHTLHFWNLRARKNIQSIDLGANHQMVLEIRPAHDPSKDYGFVGVVVDTTNLEASIWTWYRENGKFKALKTATIPPEPADAAKLPDLLKGFGAVPPLVSDIDLSMDDKHLYVACWGTGELRQYDVSDPMKPEALRVDQGRWHREPYAAPQREGVRRRARRWSRSAATAKRVYFTNSLYSTWDDQFYPEGVPGPAGHGSCQAGGRNRAGQGVLRRVRGGVPVAPDASRGWRLLDRLVLLPVVVVEGVNS